MNGGRSILSLTSRFMRRNKQIDFLFALFRPEFEDFVLPIATKLQAMQMNVAVKRGPELNDFIAKIKSSKVIHPKVVITTNEVNSIAHFSRSKKVLLPHAIFLPDHTPTPISLSNPSFFCFDYYFAPNGFWMEWYLKSLIDAAYWMPIQEIEQTQKCIVPGGYVKTLPPVLTNSSKNVGVKTIVYATNVFSPELHGHRFHLDGQKILHELAVAFPEANILCRPHPTDSKREFVEKTKNALSQFRNVEFDTTGQPTKKIYAEADVFITDLSSTAFVHEYVTARKPIFFASEELQNEFTRFFKLVKKFGYAISTTQELIELIKLKFEKDDVLSETELLAFRNILLNRNNNLEQLASDLTNIKDSKRAVHWLVLPT